MSTPEPSLSVTYTPAGKQIFDKYGDNTESYNVTFSAFIPPQTGDRVLMAGKNGRKVPFTIARRAYDFTGSSASVTYIVLEPIPDFDYTSLE